MDASFFGTWNVDKTKTTGLEEFGKLMGFTEDKIQLYRNLEYSFTISKDGDTFKIEIDFQGKAPNATYELQLGQEVDYKSIDGYTAKLTLTVEDGKTVESYYYGDKDLKWTVTRSVEGNIMTAVTKLGAAELVQTLNKA